MLDAANFPRRLLLIDESAPFRQTLARLLRVAGHTVVEAETGAAGLALLRQQPLDLVVTDLDMRGLTGWDVARLIKATDPQLPVVLVTGGTGSVAPDRRTPAPVDAILWKPFPFAELLAVLARLRRGDTSALVGAMGGPTTGQIATDLHRAGHKPGAPVGTGAAPGQPHRRTRRSLALSAR